MNQILIAASLHPLLSVVVPDLTRMCVILVIILIVCGLMAFLVSRAPWIEEPFKSAVKWLLLAVPIIYVIVCLLKFL